ncbi:hypothetical protein FVB9532_00784 [Mesonia oceanica]|uniref:Uncharacterized protein n=1 Tax=Mesonia oceanica TaxID=2687242 RepID=A0AC61Y4V5_9FLAO|nr:hypothetical protein FVB9532_00784 [Mesonia oceanica]|tara:strand:+ start:149 stop:931 length:783 start_codon:yes stop_codon:yes gene_type:complete
MAEERQGISPYSYVQNNPLNRIDPTGMLDESVQGPTDWYEDKDGNIIFVPVSREIEGYENIGSWTNVAADKNLRLNEDGTATNVDSGTQYGPDSEIMVTNDHSVSTIRSGFEDGAAKTYGVNVGGALGGGIGISFGYAEDATGNGGLYFTFSGNIGLGGDFGPDLGKALPNNKNSSVLIGDLVGTEYSHNFSIGPLGIDSGGTVQSNVKGLGLMNFDNYGKNYNGYLYGKGGLSSFSSNYLQEPGLGYMFSKDKTWVWDF